MNLFKLFKCLKMDRIIKSRRLYLIGICFSLLINSINVSAQTDWSFVALTSGGNTVFIDKNFTRASNGIIRVWQKNVSPDNSYFIGLGEWNCLKKSFRIVQSIMYDNTGIASDRNSEPSQWRIVIPDSTGMLLYLNICEENQDIDVNEQENRNSKSSIAQIIVKKTNLMSKANSNSKIIRQLVLGEKLVLTGKKLGTWHQVFDSKSNSQGFLNRKNFKVVKTNKSTKRNRANKTK